MAIAYALDVSPLALLVPFTQAPSDVVEKPAGIGESMDAMTAWSWALGAEPRSYDTGNRDYQMAAWSAFRGRSHPWWLTLDVSLNERLIAELRRRPSIPRSVSGRPDPMYDDVQGSSAEWYRTEGNGEHQAKA